MASAPLAREIALYRERRDELLKTALGQYVLIKGEDIVGFYATLEEAPTAGYTQFKLEPFLARQVSAADETVNFTSFMITH